MINIKECTKSPVRFDFLRENVAYYRTVNDDLFAVPLSDLGNATLKAEDKGIYFMRYMRKHNEMLDGEIVSTV